MNPPSAHPTCNAAAFDVAIDIVSPIDRRDTDELLWELRQSHRLGEAGERVDQRRRVSCRVSAAITRWNKDDPTSWERVRDCSPRGLRIIET